MKVVFTGGGTGGHIYPALSLWQHMKTVHPDASALYIGTNEGLERGIVSRTELPFCAISAAGLKRQLNLSAAKTAGKTLRGYFQAKRHLRTFKPDVVVGTGGYVTLPVIYAARALGIPSVIWEGNARPGLTNQLCARRATAVAVVFPDSRKWFRKDAAHVRVTGNPRASEVLQVKQADIDAMTRAHNVQPTQKLILVYAGSRGAETVNRVMAKMAERFSTRPTWRLMVVTGEKHFATAQIAFGQCPANVELVPFFYDMPAVLPRADVVITRAGSSTLAEICALGLASILIPSPYVTANHQEQNAQQLASVGATRMLREADLTPDVLWNELVKLLDGGEAEQVRNAARSLATPNAVESLYDLVMATVSDAVK